MSNDSLSIETATPAEIVPGLRLLFQHLPAADLEPNMSHVHYLFDLGELDCMNLLVYRTQGLLKGAVLFTNPNGGIAEVLPAQTPCDEPNHDVEDALMSNCFHRLRKLGVRVVQTQMFRQKSSLRHDVLIRNQFRCVSTMVYMEKNLGDMIPRYDQHKLNFVQYHSVPKEEFVNAIIATHQQTLDIPEMNGRRTPQEIIDGHYGYCSFEPRLWWVVRHTDQTIGVLLLAPFLEQHTCELSYFGLGQEYRGQGFGRQILGWALNHASSIGARSMSLSVDERNHPALYLYKSLGFMENDRRQIYLAFLDSLIDHA